MAGTRTNSDLTSSVANGGVAHSQPFPRSFQFRDGERQGLDALFERVFFDTCFSPSAKKALLRTRYRALPPGSQSAVDATEEAREKSRAQEGAAGVDAETDPKERTATPDGIGDDPRYVLLYRGANGIGKTRVFRQFMESAHQKQIPVYEVHYHDVEGIPFKPFLHAIRAILRDHDKGSVLQEKYRYALEGLIPEFFPDSAERSSDAAISPERLETEKVRLFDGITQLLLEVTSQRPLLLLAHDLHWSDAPTIELLRYIGRNLQLRNRGPDLSSSEVSLPEVEAESDLDGLDGDEEEWRSLNRAHIQTNDYLNHLLQLAKPGPGAQRSSPPARLMRKKKEKQ